MIIEPRASGLFFPEEETALDTFTVKLLVESNGGNPQNVVLYIGAQPGATDGYDNNLDQFYPPLCPGCNFEAFFPYPHPNLPKLVRDIRSSDTLRHVWTIVTSGKTGMMTWYPHTFPRHGTFLFENVTDMRRTTTSAFAVRDTMVIVYNKPGALPDIEIPTDTHDFGAVLLGSELMWEFPVRNRGNGDLVLKSGASDRVEFRVTWPGFPCGIAPLDSVEARLSFVPQALGPAMGQVRLDSSDPDESSISVMVSGTGVTPEIEVSALSHDFGTVEVGASGRWMCDISNSGTGDLIIDQVSSSNPRFSADLCDFVLQPGSSRSVEVTFNPTRSGAVSAELSISSNDLDEHLVIVSVTGTGIAGDIVLSASRHDFGIVPVGHAARWTLEVANRGAALLCVDTTVATPSVFTVSPVSFCLAPDSIRQLTITYIPASTVAVSGQLSIVSNDPDEPVKYVALAGEGVEIIEPDIHIEEKNHDFGQVAIGTSSQWSFDVVNVGQGDLVVDGISVMHPHFAAEPSLFTVNAFGLQPVQVSFTPAAAETVSTLLVVRSNDRDEPACSLVVNGIGIEGSGIEDDLDNSLPSDFRLFQNNPNPFNPTTTITYSLPVQSEEFRVKGGDGTFHSIPLTLHVTLKIFNVLGQEVRTLVDEQQHAGTHHIVWDGRNDADQEMSSGIYWYRLQAEGFTEIRKMTLIR